MRRALLFIATAALFLLIPATTALGTVGQVHDSVHHAVEVRHDTNICGDLATFTFDITSHTHVLDNGNTFLFADHASFKYTLVFDDPALGTWTAHGAENFHAVVNHSGEVFENISNSKEGSIQIIEHEVFHIDADGNVRVDRTFEKIGDC